MNEAALAVLRCPHCRSNALRGSDVPRCAVCGESVRVEQGIPILVRDWSPLQEQIAAAAQVKPNWYREEQPPEQSSPWRHHLRKRRQYVQGAGQASVAATNHKSARPARPWLRRRQQLGMVVGIRRACLPRQASSLYLLATTQ